MGVGHPDKIVRNQGARIGDVLILGKPLGIGVFSAALKQERLDAAAYAEMIASTTRLNTPGTELAALDGVHAMTDVTGFGLLGQLSEICRASNVAAALDDASAPIFSAAAVLAEAGVKTGASERNWNAISTMIDAPDNWSGLRRDLLTDPQTSGGLLVFLRARHSWRRVERLRRP